MHAQLTDGWIAGGGTAWMVALAAVATVAAVLAFVAHRAGRRGWAAVSLRDEQMREVVLSAFHVRGARHRLAAVIGHALSFETWRSLCVEQGLSQSGADEVMVRLAETVAADRPPRRTAK